MVDVWMDRGLCSPLSVVWRFMVVMWMWKLVGILLRDVSNWLYGLYGWVEGL